MFTRRPPRLGGEFRGFAAQYFAQAAEILNYSSTESAERGFDFIVIIVFSELCVLGVSAVNAPNSFWLRLRMIWANSNLPKETARV